ncbi:MAG TPA: thiamine phosphate synthase [Pyrinomonadaceae bacterium]
MQFELPRVYPLTDVTFCGLSHAEQVRRLASGGASLIQLREKRLSSRDLYREAETTLKVAHELGVRLIINDRVDIALAIRADGVHLGQDDLTPAAARQLLGPDAIIGFSTHNLAQALEAVELPIDYLAFGPIFPTGTKSDTSPVVGLAALKEVRTAIDKKPLVAIGGINSENAPDVTQHGADSVAVISCLLSDPPAISTRTAHLFKTLN